MPERSRNGITSAITGRDANRGTSDTSLRPPLPSMEALDDRVMLSTTTPTGSADLSAVLIGLMKASVPVVEGELILFKQALIEDKRKDKWMPVINSDFGKINSLLFGGGSDLINAKFNKHAVSTLKHTLAPDFNKIGTLLHKYAPTATDLSAPLQSLSTGALALVTALSQFKNQVVSQKVKTQFLNLSGDFQKLGGDFLALGQDILQKASAAQDNALQGKLQTLFNKMETLVKVKLGGDQTLLATVQDAQTQITAFLNGLSGTGASFTGGPAVAGNGDKIS